MKQLLLIYVKWAGGSYAKDFLRLLWLPLRHKPAKLGRI